MGNTNGRICRYGWCIRPDNSNSCKENHTSTPKFRAHKHNLSTAFNLDEHDKEFSVGLLNINTATEEELMTLPEINRQTAHNIIDYRAKIGAFKRVEDLALVSGVGATKLEILRLEISVSRNKTSQNSSTIDLAIQDNVSRSSSKSQSTRGNVPFSFPKVNINTSNVFQLMKVKGISQQLGENIVSYRDKRGLFRRTDDLLKVKGIKQPLLSAIRPHIVLSDDELSCRTDPSGNDFVITSQANDSLSGPENASNGTQSANPGNLSVLGSQEDLVSLYGPIARRSMRHKRKPFFFRKNGQSVIRLATWNLQHCNEEKTENPGVREVFAMTVLENGLSIIAIQDVRDKTVLQKLCDELNQPTVPNVKKWHGHRGHWKCVTSQAVVNGQAKDGEEYLGFLYDSGRDVEFSNISVLDKCSSKNKPFDIKPVVAVFKVSGVLELVCVSVHMDSRPRREEADLARHRSVMADVIEAVEDFLPGEKDILIMGDFGTSPDDEMFAGMMEHQYRNMLNSHAYTNTSTRNPEGTVCSQNIWLGSQIQRLYTETSEVIREGMTSPWIPDGWGWGGVISHHCPVYTELYLPDAMAIGDTNANSLNAIKLTLPMSGAGDS